jgi:hypothetical protein
MDRKLLSLIDVKRKLKKMKIDNSFPAIVELNACFKEYIYNKDINAIIDFPEFNKEIHIQLSNEFPENNVVVFKVKN